MNEPIVSTSSGTDYSKGTAKGFGAPPTPPDSKKPSPEILLERAHLIQSGPPSPDSPLNHWPITSTFSEDTPPVSSLTPGLVRLEGLGISISESDHVQGDQSLPSAQASKPQLTPYPQDSSSDNQQRADLVSVKTAAVSGTEPKPFLQRFFSRISQVTSTLARQRDKARERRVGNLLQSIEEISRGAHDSNSREVIEKKILPRDYEIFHDVTYSRSYEHLIGKYDEPEKLRGYIKQSLSYEYRPSTRGRHQFRILMESAVHNRIGCYWDKKVGDWLDSIQLITNTEDVPRMVKSWGRTQVLLGGIIYRPDCYYEFRERFKNKTVNNSTEGSWPSLVVEVIWSHPLGQVKINDYFQKSKGAIRTVVSIDLSKTYKQWDEIKQEWKTDSNNLRGPVEIHVWHAQRDDNENLQAIESLVVKVCGEDGTADTAQRSCVSLRDFVSETDEYSMKMSAEQVRELDDLTLSLDMKEFVDEINEALEKQREEDMIRERQVGRKKPTKKQEEDTKKGRAKAKHRGLNDKRRSGDEAKKVAKTIIRVSKDLGKYAEIGGRALRWLPRKREG
ncbi:hypothetical protein F5Y01DRAFT_318992 [Xylaria sp. FL0043]|nr:hypothetical protein F5Y01DRAFT_318992 [Xylaria sp. FL0043]